MRSRVDDAVEELWTRRQAADAHAIAIVSSYVGKVASRWPVLSEIEDIRQDVLERILLADRLPESPRAWVAVVTRNIALNHVRRYVRQKTTPMGDNDCYAEPDPRHPAEIVEATLAGVSAAIDTAQSKSERGKIAESMRCALLRALGSSTGEIRENIGDGASDAVIWQRCRRGQAPLSAMLLELAFHARGKTEQAEEVLFALERAVSRERADAGKARPERRKAA